MYPNTCNNDGGHEREENYYNAIILHYLCRQLHRYIFSSGLSISNNDESSTPDFVSVGTLRTIGINLESSSLS